MKIRHYIAALALAAFAFGTVSCEDEQNLYTRADQVPADCQQVYFSSGNTTEYTFASTDDIGTMTMEMVVKRNKTDKAASVPVIANFNSDVFSVPSTVEFAAGEDESTLTVAIIDKLGGTYTVSLALDGDEFVDPYTIFDGSPLASISIDLEEWEELHAKNESEIFGTTFDVIITHKVGSNVYNFGSIWGGIDEGFQLVDNGDEGFALNPSANASKWRLIDYTDDDNTWAYYPRTYEYYFYIDDATYSVFNAEERYFLLSAYEYYYLTDYFEDYITW